MWSAMQTHNSKTSTHECVRARESTRDSRPPHTIISKDDTQTERIHKCLSLSVFTLLTLPAIILIAISSCAHYYRNIFVWLHSPPWKNIFTKLSVYIYCYLQEHKNKCLSNTCQSFTIHTNKPESEERVQRICQPEKIERLCWLGRGWMNAQILNSRPVQITRCFSQPKSIDHSMLDTVETLRGATGVWTAINSDRLLCRRQKRQNKWGAVALIVAGSSSRI